MSATPAVAVNGGESRRHRSPFARNMRMFLSSRLAMAATVVTVGFVLIALSVHRIRQAED